MIQTWQKPLTYKEDGVSVSEDSEDGSQFYHQRENLLEQAEEAETSNGCYKYTTATYLEFSEESLKFLQATTVNTFVNSEMDIYCAAETPCSSDNDCESEVPVEEEEEEEEEDDVYEYEPRHDINY